MKPMAKRTVELAAIAAALLAGACSKVPGGVIPPDRMAELLADFHTGEAVVDMNRTEFYNDSLRQLYKQSVYARHGVTPEEVDSSFSWYGRHMAEYMEVYDKTIEILDHRLIETGNRIAAEAALSIAGDSVDVWPNARFITFSSTMPSRIAAFSFSNDENWERGDSYTWRAKFFNNTENLCFTMVTEYTDGTVEIATRNFSADGWNELVFNTDSTLTANRIYGFIEGLSRPGTMLRTDSMEMIRKRVDHNTPVSRYNVRTYRRLADVIDTPVASEKREQATDSIQS